MSATNETKKKRGRKPKSVSADNLEQPSLSSAPSSYSRKRIGKLNILVVENDEDETKEISMMNCQKDNIVPSEIRDKKDNVSDLEKRMNKLYIKENGSDVNNTESCQNLNVANVPSALTIELDKNVVSKTFNNKQSLERRLACENRPGYFNLLEDFVEVYPNKTNILCWWCCHSFDTVPLGIPLRHDKNLDVFKVVGCFCSMNCAFAHSRKENLKVSPSDFRFMYEKITGKVTEEWNLSPAPEKYILKSFGGPFSIEEYRSSFYNQYEIMYTPMMPFGMLCDEILGRSLSRGWTKDGIKRPLEIRKAKINTSQTIMEKKQASINSSKLKTSVNHMISFEDAAAFS